MAKENRETNDSAMRHALNVLRADLGQAEDAIARAKMQQKRFPYDHDNNDALVRYQKWYEKAFLSIQLVEQAFAEIK